MGGCSLFYFPFFAASFLVPRRGCELDQRRHFVIDQRRKNSVPHGKIHPVCIHTEYPNFFVSPSLVWIARLEFAINWAFGLAGKRHVRGTPTATFYTYAHHLMNKIRTLYLCLWTEAARLYIFRSPPPCAHKEKLLAGDERRNLPKAASGEFHGANIGSVGFGRKWASVLDYFLVKTRFGPLSTRVYAKTKRCCHDQTFTPKDNGRLFKILLP